MNAVKKLATVFALMLMTIAPITGASAHTKIDHTSPASGSTVDAGVQNVAVDFTDKIMNLADSTEIVISDPEGNTVENTCVEVKNTSISVDAFLATAGEYQVAWRTVAEDGHPIEGNFNFTVSGSADGGEFVSCLESASQGNQVTATPKAVPLAAVEKEVTPDTGVAWPFWAAGILAIGVGVVVLVRRKNSKG